MRNTALVLASMAIATCVLALLLVVQRPADAAFPGENGDIAFSGGCLLRSNGLEDHCMPRIFRRNAEDGLSRLLANPGKSPSWSANGRRIAFVSAGEVWVMDADGSNKVQLTNSRDYSNLDPAWFPGGKRIAISSNRHHKYEANIYILKLNAAHDDVVGVRQLTDHPSQDIQPSVSPSGKKIAFVSRRNGNEPAIFTMRTDSAEGFRGHNIPVRLTANAKETYDPDSSPDWSPDGKRIVFTSRPPDRVREIHVMDANGDHKEALTDGRDRPLGQTGIAAYNPVFSPDGQKIAFVRYDISEIENPRGWVMDADGSDLIVIPLLNAPGEPGSFFYRSYVAELDWQPVP